MKSLPVRARLTLLSGFFCALLFTRAARAMNDSFHLNCLPAGTTAVATVSVELEIEPATSGGVVTGHAVMSVVFQNTDGSAPLRQENIEVRGEIENAEDEGGQHPYRVLFGQPLKVGEDLTYSRIAIADTNGSLLPNSYIRDKRGTYYYARCQAFQSATHP